MSYLSLRSKIWPTLVVQSIALSVLFAQAPTVPSVTGGVVQASVTSAGPLFHYSYQVTNALTSSAPIWRISLDIRQVSGGASLPNTNLPNGGCYLANVAAQVLSNPKNPVMVPVAFDGPQQWLCGPSGKGTAQWGATTVSAQIGPGGQTSGFQLISAGLPGIRIVTLEPQVDLSKLSIPPPVDGSPAQIRGYLTQVAGVRSSVSFTLTTIGPIAPLLNFSPSDFLKTIVSYKEQAFALGWIASAGIKMSLDAKLNAAQAALNSGNAAEAKNQLNALLSEISAQAGKQLTSEAVALLQFNTQYLMSKLP